MIAGVAVIDTGKTTSRVSVFQAGQRTFFKSAPTPYLTTALGREIDAHSLFAWLLDALRNAYEAVGFSAIVPVAHGATAVLVDADGMLATGVVDYENEISKSTHDAYEALRPSFAETGSPSLPMGLNLGRQLYWLDRSGALEKAAYILLYPQYWAYRLSGVAATEVTSIGCHTDLWRPQEGRYSQLTIAQGWRRLFPEMRKASDCLGVILPDLAARIGCEEGVRVYCGLHDSNGALAALRASAALRNADPILISTGTWSIIFTPNIKVDHLDPDDDTLINVDVDGRPVAAIRFMAGREYAAVNPGRETTFSTAALGRIVEQRVFALPSFTRSGGPFQGRKGAVTHSDLSAEERCALASVYIALVWDDMIARLAADGARPIIVEGPAATDEICGLLAGLRSPQQVMIAKSGVSPSAGAAHLAAGGEHAPEAQISVVEAPQNIDFQGYRSAWRSLVNTADTAAAMEVVE